MAAFKGSRECGKIKSTFRHWHVGQKGESQLNDMLDPGATYLRLTMRHTEMAIGQSITVKRHCPQGSEVASLCPGANIIHSSNGACTTAARVASTSFKSMMVNTRTSRTSPLVLDAAKNRQHVFQTYSVTSSGIWNDVAGLRCRSASSFVLVEEGAGAWAANAIAIDTAFVGTTADQT